MSARASTPSTTLRGRWLVVGRMAWVAVAILTTVVFVSGLPSEFARLRVPCDDVASCAWIPRFTAEDAHELGQLGLSSDLFAAYFVASEALANAAKHGRATRAELVARQEDGDLRLTVRDDGIGGAALGGGSGTGLQGLADLVATLLARSRTAAPGRRAVEPT